MARPEGNVLKNAAILPQRHFALGAAVQIVEDSLRQPFSRDRTKIWDGDDTRRFHRASSLYAQFRHRSMRLEPIDINTAEKEFGSFVPVPFDP
jgi:hypothetical protein